MDGGADVLRARTFPPQRQRLGSNPTHDLVDDKQSKLIIEDASGSQGKGYKPFKLQDLTVTDGWERSTCRHTVADQHRGHGRPDPRASGDLPYGGLMSSDAAANFLARGSIPHTLRAVQTQPNAEGTGGWEVVLSLDGFYWRREDAVRAAEQWNAWAREASLDIVRGQDATGL